MLDHIFFLLKALAAAAKNRGYCAPNPAVGAVLVRDQCIIAEGSHQGPGTSHAEVLALQGVDIHELDILYVTLEPCCHFGRTPPCTHFIERMGIKKVYYAYQDPNPLVAGKGAAYLNERGISCERIECSAINSFYQSYLFWNQHRRPFVTAKLAISIDGKISLAHGQPVQLTGKDCNRYTHKCRNNSDAILTSINTVINDDPQLNVRIDDRVIAKPIYILDSQLRMPLSAQVISKSKSLTIFYTHDAQNRVKSLESLGIRCLAMPSCKQGVDLEKALNILGKDGVHDVWVEAGSQCFESFFTQELMNRAYIYISPKVVGQEGLAAFSKPVNLLENSRSVKWKMLGEDLLCEIAVSL